MADVFDFYVQDNRKITFEIAEPIMREDNGVTDFQFHVPKTINGLDMTGWAWWFVFVNADKHKYTEPLVLTDDPERPLEYSVGTYTVDYGMSIKAGTVSFALEAINSDAGGTILNEWHTFTYRTTVKETLQGNQVDYDETQSDIISALLIEVQNKINQLTGGATPEVKDSISDMIDTKKVYILSTDKNWYYYNGSTWVPGGLYGIGDPETVVDAVNDWLDDHPEATTTVQDGAVTSAKLANNAVTEPKLASNSVSSAKIQDGAITEAKFASALKLKTIKDYVTPEMFGAVGDGVTDDTQALQDAIDHGFANKKTVFLTGNYLITDSLKVIGVSVTAENTGTEIIGNGYAHLIAETAITNIIETSPNTDTRTYGVKIKNLILDGNNQVVNGIYSRYSTSECIFENLTINKCTNGIRINGNCYLNNFRNVRTYHCVTYGILLESGNNTSNIFEKCYIDTCANAYKINGQYSSMISCCADNITGVVFELNSFTGALIGCGSESNNFTTMFKVATNTNVALLGGLYFGNPSLSGYYFEVGSGCRLGVYNCVINYMGASDSTGALYQLSAQARLLFKEVSIYKPFIGNNSESSTARFIDNAAAKTITESVTLDANNEADLSISATRYFIIDIFSTNRSGWKIIYYRASTTTYRIKVLSSTEYFPNIADKNFTLSISYADRTTI